MLKTLPPEPLFPDNEYKLVESKETQCISCVKVWQLEV